MDTFKQYLKHPGMWINALLGRPTHIEIPQNQVTYQESGIKNQGDGQSLNAKSQMLNEETGEGMPNDKLPMTNNGGGGQRTINEQWTQQPQQGMPASEDPLTGDLAKAGNLIKGLTSKLQKTAEPMTTQVQATASQMQTNANAFVKTDKFKKIIPILIFGVVILIIVLAVIILAPKVLQNIKNGSKEPTQIVSEPTITPAEYTPEVPSVYATDEDVLKLEEQILTLDREVVGTQVKETTLNPPGLDFNINFQ